MTSAAEPVPATSDLPMPLQHPSSSPAQLIAQGAEGRLYKTTYLLPTLPCALKYRPPKPYRHPALDQRLTRQRILAEARILLKCRRENVPVPAVYAVEETTGCLAAEWVDGEPVRVRLNEWLARNKVSRGVEVSEADLERVRGSRELRDLMRRVGEAVGRLHAIGVVHGDLTTSNMMLRPAVGAPEGEGVLEGEIVLIDFGLASVSAMVEDRAVDLYVLERAFGSTHPRAEDIFDELLDGYKAAFKQAGPTLKKLDEVRLRGRKRSMIG
jgi:TP53 regulating kinase and related kinases